MKSSLPITGVILAGGLARRMNHQDKGLLLYNGHALICYAIAAMSPLVKSLFISANRHHNIYQTFGYPVLADKQFLFAGPLAGILTALTVCENGILLVMPCDSPLFKTCHLQKLCDALLDSEHDLAVAFDGQRRHSVFLALKTSLQANLAEYLAQGERKLENWLIQQHFIEVDLSDERAIFTNLNSDADWAAL